MIKSLKEGNENFEFTDEGYLKSCLGFDTAQNKYGRIEVTQTHIAERFITLVDREQNINTKSKSATKSLLHKDMEGLERKKERIFGTTCK